MVTINLSPLTLVALGGASAAAAVTVTTGVAYCYWRASATKPPQLPTEQLAAAVKASTPDIWQTLETTGQALVHNKGACSEDLELLREAINGREAEFQEELTLLAAAQTPDEWAAILYPLYNKASSPS